MEVLCKKNSGRAAAMVHSNYLKTSQGSLAEHAALPRTAEKRTTAVAAKMSRKLRVSDRKLSRLLLAWSLRLACLCFLSVHEVSETRPSEFGTEADAAVSARVAMWISETIDQRCAAHSLHPRREHALAKPF